MSSYILFSQTSTANGERNNWTDAGGAGAVSSVVAPGNTTPTSLFNADTLGPLGPQAALFDISAGPNGALAGLGDIESDGAAASALFGAANTKLQRNNVGGDTIDLAQRDQDWNGIKNLEIKLDSESQFTNVKLENFVDARVKIGDDACALVADQDGRAAFNVDFAGVKRGEVDGTYASAKLNVSIDVWSNTSDWQNAFDMKGSVYNDTVLVGSGTVTGSMFGNKFNQTGYDGDGSYDGSFTKVFMNLGAGADSFDSTNSAGDVLTGKAFKSQEKVWGGTGDDVISTGAGVDTLFGDNGSGANAYADPASLVTPVAFDFRTAVIPGIASNDFGDFTVDAIGGVLSKVGNASFGGLSVRSASDGAPGQAFTNEIDAFNDTPEGVKITFDTAVAGTEILLNLFFSAAADFEDITEKVNFKVTFADNTFVTGSELATADDPPNPIPPEGAGALLLEFDSADFGGKLIKSVELSPDTLLKAPNNKPVSEFVVASVEYCTPIPGADGNDILDAGKQADFLQGDGDRGAIVLIPAGLDLIVNGGFEVFNVAPDAETVSHDGATWYTFKEDLIDNVPGWDAGPAGPIEIQLGNTGLLPPHSGNAKLELDSHPDFAPGTNAVVSQEVAALTGETYTLDFFYSPRLPDNGPAQNGDTVGSSGFDVFWNGALVFQFTDPAPGTPGWQHFAIDVQGAAGLDKLEFAATGAENTFGAFIDDVSLKAKHAFVDLAGAGDQLFLGLNDAAKDIVNYVEANSDGFDVVRQFEKGTDQLKMDLIGAPATATVTEVMTAEGLSTLISLNADPTHGVLIIGQTSLGIGTDIVFS